MDTEAALIALLSRVPVADRERVLDVLRALAAPAS